LFVYDPQMEMVVVHVSFDIYYLIIYFAAYN